MEWKVSVNASTFKWPFIVSLFFGACILSAVNKSSNHTMLRHDDSARHTRTSSLAEAAMAEQAARVGIDFADRTHAHYICTVKLLSVCLSMVKACH